MEDGVGRMEGGPGEGERKEGGIVRSPPAGPVRRPVLFAGG